MTGAEILWNRDSHTAGKHEVLRHYLKAWFPILTSFRSVLFIDGFAGPGEYAGGEDGSPIIALKTFLQHRATMKAQVRFVFIEKEPEVAGHLERLLHTFRPSLPATCTVDPVIVGSFDEKLPDLLNLLDAQGEKRAAFVMIDPFGVSHTPMRVIGRILGGERNEVYVSVMYEWLNRFLTTPEFQQHLTGLFGTNDWRHALIITDGEERKTFLYSLYDKQLRAHGATQVVHFDLYEGKRLVYAIFFASKHWKGADKMKEAIWKVVPTGDFAFHGTRSTQLSLAPAMLNFTPLQLALKQQFGDKGWVDMAAIEEFVGSDRTDFHTGHLRQHALEPLEDSGAIEVQRPTRRKHTYKDSRLRFK